MSDACRCGWDGQGEHPCHHGGYACGRPSKPRLVLLGWSRLPGMQLKASAYETFACDEHWAEFDSRIVYAHRECLVEAAEDDDYSGRIDAVDGQKPCRACNGEGVR